MPILNKKNTSANMSLELKVSQDLGVAHAALTPSDSPLELSMDILTRMISEHGIADWDIDFTALEKLLADFAKGIPTETLFATRLDAEWDFKVSNDKMVVQIKVKPAKGGTPIQAKTLLQQLIGLKIDQKRINGRALKALETLTKPAKTVVATGKKAVMGRNSRFESLIGDEPEAQNGPKEDASGRVDFLAGKDYLTVEEGTPLVRRHPPTNGQVGMDVYGKIIQPTPGKSIPFAEDMQGVAMSDADSEVLVSTTAGHPIILSDGAKVDPTLKFDNVGLNTGHITFDGSLDIRGDVMSGINIDVTGDVFIKGSVESATISAGNDIHIGGGALGNIDLREQEGGQSECRLTAQGSVEVRYANLAAIEAKKDIIIREYSFNSDLDAGNIIQLGQTGGKGNLVGGNIVAGQAVTAKVLGSQAYVHTRIQVGASRNDLEQALHLKRLHTERVKKMAQMKAYYMLVKTKIENNSATADEKHKARQAQESMKQMQEILLDIEGKMNSIKFAKFITDAPNITANQECFPNCFLTINGSSFKTDREYRAVSFIRKGGRITTR
ncbi:DUF342 domain-containing protein [Reinekea thalattae]|uniref:DUF342 domain-containing protein n=1 Tax=Reinekea thalattae TaxID=2593301 RepID=A0A5C8Z4R4_9GAMM|nr:FapA family protein [Reinekea thalattae]TXR53012.1 DUF342 domain-containing protein [Reinekea thalattae]